CCPAVPHVLDSFPTRRSSDLGQIEIALKPDVASPDGSGGAFDGAMADGAFDAAYRRLLLFDDGGKRQAVEFDCRRQRQLPIARRSEEHTSELQSRENLVCRLL